ncbi:hypothetical protein DCAR_0933348 [Daucus carota subsp. sativus]|uniref:Uncharacterized protein n=1 Tax=Daucus carota subsp. sativus TaxID=79200 RepID=A0A175YCS3_DAUCS|nr:PREDICTED: uncharacterized protein LOC108200930 [Daucus carota subsp. sativus]WOH13837.1 hypothetical protein DCAR_0933348 [Daucus carota subsp. sativus]
MQVTQPSSPRTDQEFNFTSTSTSPYVTAPSSPQRFGTYIFTTAPTTPSRAAPHGTTPSTIPFNWEEKPGTPKSVSSHYDTDVDEDFAFDFSGYLEPPSLLPADELFSGGKIKPLKLKLPPRLNNLETNLINLESPKSPRAKIKEALTLTLSFSPRKKSSDDFDPFAAAMEETRRPEKVPAANWYKKWKLKNLLLFRSASEGHKEKYELLKKSGKNRDSKNWSFRSVDNDGGGSVGSRKMSAHEWHYTVNRSVAEEMRKKTYLPYKQGFFGCLGFRVSGVHEISNRGIVSAMGRE